MSILSKVRARNTEERNTKQPADGWELVGERNGKPLYRYTKKDNFRKTERRPASNVRRLLPQEDTAHVAGGKCPHCGGCGEYFNHTKRTWGKCFRCDGKGVLDLRDIGFYQKRKLTDAPLCTVYGGVAA